MFTRECFAKSARELSTSQSKAHVLLAAHELSLNELHAQRYSEPTNTLWQAILPKYTY